MANPRFPLPAILIVLYSACTTAFACCNPASPKQKLEYSDMQDYATLNWAEDSSLLIFAGNESLPTRELTLNKGKYVLKFKARASVTSNGSPHFMIKLKNYVLVNLDLDEGTKLYSIKFELPEKTTSKVNLIFDNDQADSTGDRNIFLHFPLEINPY